MNTIEKLTVHEEWLAFLEYKLGGGHLTATDAEALTSFIENKSYLPAAQRISNGGLFSLPEAVKVNKSNSTKKRTVFVFPEEEMLLQKFLAYQLLQYDGVFSDNLYSFRRDMGVKKAVTRLVFRKGIKEMYSFKLDISDYFNSVNPRLLLPRLKEVLAGDAQLYSLIEAMLTETRAVVEGETVQMQKGILAGSPLSGFLANLYLAGLDSYFEHRGVLYARYSDDIICFADTIEELEEYKAVILKVLDEKELKVNENKVFQTAPGECWSFLGFRFENGVIDISDISKLKLKKKMRRKARALNRWKSRTGAEPERAAAAYIRYFNKKLYQNPVNNEITWARWYFPIINTADSLKELDEYMQQCIRFVATGKQNKSRYNFSYEKMKSLGYVTLVNNYYKGRVKNKPAN